MYGQRYRKTAAAPGCSGCHLTFLFYSRFSNNGTWHAPGVATHSKQSGDYMNLKRCKYFLYAPRLLRNCVRWQFNILCFRSIRKCTAPAAFSKITLTSSVLVFFLEARNYVGADSSCFSGRNRQKVQGNHSRGDTHCLTRAKHP